MFEIQIKIVDKKGNIEWKSVTPSHSDKPYRFKNREEASHMIWICYPESEDIQMRIKEV